LSIARETHPRNWNEIELRDENAEAVSAMKQVGSLRRKILEIESEKRKQKGEWANSTLKKSRQDQEKALAEYDEKVIPLRETIAELVSQS